MKPARILLVEDNAMNRQLARDLLQYHGHEVVEARSVEEGWTALETNASFDIVLLDIQMPGGGGPELLRRIRTASALSSLPVIAVTAFAMDGDRERFLRDGFDGYLSKPIDTRSFVATVESFVRKREAEK